MRATEQIILEAFAKFNDLCFGGELPPIPVKIVKARTFLGKVTFEGRRNLLGKVVRNTNFTLRISSSFDLSQTELEDIVIHEMIHYHMALHCIKDTSAHGKVFRGMMEDINSKFGRHIAVSHHFKEGMAGGGENLVRENNLCVTQLSDGSWGITSCTTAKIPEMKRRLPRYYRLRSMTWYTSTDPFFNRYPRSKTPKIYKITREQLDEHLNKPVRETPESAHRT